MMKQRFSTLHTGGILLTMLLFAAVNDSWATTHIVQFGGSFGLSYSPDNFSAQVGDTVQWEGDFSLHPLSSTAVPANAETWHNPTGTTFIYVIKIPGNYSYHCDVHASFGMTGTFEASGAGVRNEQSQSQTAQMTQIMFAGEKRSGSSSVTFIVPHTEYVLLEVFDILGHAMATAVHQNMKAGTYTVSLGAYIPAHGYYFVRLSGDGAEVVRKIHVVD
jgi:plastocyanin